MSKLSIRRGNPFRSDRKWPSNDTSEEVRTVQPILKRHHCLLAKRRLRDLAFFPFGCICSRIRTWINLRIKRQGFRETGLSRARRVLRPSVSTPFCSPDGRLWQSRSTSGLQLQWISAFSFGKISHYWPLKLSKIFRRQSVQQRALFFSKKQRRTPKSYKSKGFFETTEKQTPLVSTANLLPKTAIYRGPGGVTCIFSLLPVRPITPISLGLSAESSNQSIKKGKWLSSMI